MESKGIKAGMSLSALIGVVAACVPCCVALAAPLLAWLGISSIVMFEFGKYVEVVAASALVLGVLLLFRARKRAHGTQVCIRQGACGCRSVD